ncbi:hypothetical protein C8R45DRAFT_967636 [Mycena sanguinolenta]|nr:hypothetical protein C8R45DRAFT_967636 [Mycena sanguinolenta]
MLGVALCKKGNAVARGLKAWLARSAPLPVHIFVRPMLSDINPGILEELLKVAPRLGSLSMSIPPLHPTPLPLVSQLAQCRLDSLEELGLGTIEEYEDRTPLVFTAPRLRTFSTLNRGVKPIVVPWAQLTELTLDWDSPDGTLQVLTQCMNLEKLSTDTDGWSRVPRPDVGRDIPLRFSKLDSLSLNLWTERAAFFDCLSTPVLRDLQLHLNGAHWTQTYLTAFQLRAPNITSLSLTTSASFATNDLVSTIRHAPLLTNLKLMDRHKCFNDDFFRALYYHGDVTPLASRLQSLIVDSVFNRVYFTEDVLAGMIASRWWTDTELAAYAVPPAVARWTWVVLNFGYHFGRQEYHLGPRFTTMVKDKAIPPHVLKRTSCMPKSMSLD